MTGPGGAGPDLDELLRLAEAATQGARTVNAVGGVDLSGEGWYQVSVNFGHDDTGPGCMVDDGENCDNDAAFIAACSPSVVAALVGRVRAAEADAEAVKAKARAERRTRDAMTSIAEGAQTERDDALRIAERHRAENDQLRAERDVACAALAGAREGRDEARRSCVSLGTELADAHRALDGVHAVRERYLNQQIHGGWDWLYEIDAALASRPSSLADTTGEPT